MQGHQNLGRLHTDVAKRVLASGLYFHASFLLSALGGAAEVKAIVSCIADRFMALGCLVEGPVSPGFPACRGMLWNPGLPSGTRIDWCLQRAN